MNHSAHLHLSARSHHWLKDVQFVAGILVMVGGAAVLLQELVVVLEGIL